MPTFQIEGGTRTFEAGTAIIKGRRVHYSGDGAIDHCTNIQAGVGVAIRAGAVGDMVAVRLWTAEGTWQLEASGAIARGAKIEGAADGKVATQAGAGGVDLPLTNVSVATAADGDVFEAARLLVGIV